MAIGRVVSSDLAPGWRGGRRAGQVTEIDAHSKGVKHHMLINYFQNLLAQLVRNEKEQTAVEYGLVLALIAIVLVVALATGLGNVIPTITGKITTALGA